SPFNSISSLSLFHLSDTLICNICIRDLAVRKTIIFLLCLNIFQAGLNPAYAGPTGSENSATITSTTVDNKPVTISQTLHKKQNDTWQDCQYYEASSENIDRQIYNNIAQHAPLAKAMIDNEISISKKLCGTAINHYSVHAILGFLLQGKTVDENGTLDEMNLDRYTPAAIHEYAHSYTATQQHIYIIIQRQNHHRLI
ncbi:MAG: hypothetical protein OEY07_03695, partial [Gammaproteobacteria bacterium]|nr:hypothetical protein [Gammaproteobacteria bacterium]